VYVSKKTAEVITAFVANPEKFSRFFLRRASAHRGCTRHYLDSGLPWSGHTQGRDRTRALPPTHIEKDQVSRTRVAYGNSDAVVPFTSSDDDCVIIEWTILPSVWPAPDIWCSTLEQTLRSFLDDGAAVGWCAFEGTFKYPPKLFDQDEMRRETSTTEVSAVRVGSAGSEILRKR